MLKFYILVSKPQTLFRHFSPNYSNIPPEKAEVVINTQDKRAERDLIYLCRVFNVVYHVTESNGTPAKGKNSLLEIFENSPHEYCVQIDGDDFLTPHGVWLFEKVAAGKSVPDVICLKNQVSITPTGKMFSRTDNTELCLFFTVEEEGVDYEILREDMGKLIKSEEKINRFMDYHKDFYEFQGKYCEDRENHSRVVFYSKKAAAFRFPEDLVVGEDTVMYYNLKNAHFNRQLNMVCNDEAPATYVYDQALTQGTVWNHSRGFTDWTWMGEFNEYVKRLEEDGIMHEKDVPLLKINYEEDFVLEDLDTSGLCTYAKDDKYVKLPANATMDSVRYHLQNHGISIEK